MHEYEFACTTPYNNLNGGRTVYFQLFHDEASLSVILSSKIYCSQKYQYTRSLLNQVIEYENNHSYYLITRILILMI